MRMRRRVAMAALALSLGAVAAGCDSDRRAVSRDDLPDVPAEADHVVVLDSSGFDPDELEVGTDELVEFRIEGDEPRGIRTDEHEIDTGMLFPGETTSVIFDEEARHVVTDLADDGHTMVVEARSPER